MGITSMTELSPPRAAEELLTRRQIRLSLAGWARYKGFELAKHHQLIISEIEAFLKSEDDLLLLFAPPGSAKSTYVSVLLPSWYLANNPSHSILAATHSVEFAERWGRRVRNDIAAVLSLGAARLAGSHDMVSPSTFTLVFPR